MQRPIKMKTIGILGGMSNEATAEYYKMINAEVNKCLGNWDIAEILLYSVNFGNIEYFVRNKKWDEAKRYLMHNAANVEKGGADFLICVSNTMHKVLDDISDTIKIPFIHIVDPTAEAIKEAGLKKVGLLGTKATMESSFFKDRFKNKHNIELIIPNEEEQKIIDEIIFNELVKGIISEDSRRKYIEISKKMNQQGAQGLILGCTEIFLLLRQSDIPNLPMFNTTELHVKAAVKFALSSDS